MAKPALGRGLSALLSGGPAVQKPLPAVPAAPVAPAATVVTAHAALPGETVERIAPARIHPCAFQPRKDFSEEAIRELADSIREQGIVQPLIVRPAQEGYELIAGERRWRAAQLLRLAEVPVIVREADDRTVLELALIENLQRENLNPIEEAQGYAQLIEQFQLKQEDAAKKVGRNRTTVANALRLLKLAPEIQSHVREGRLSVGHAKVILALSESAKQLLAAERILKQSLNVRQTEELIAQLQASSTIAAPAGKSGAASGAGRDIHVADLENRLQQHFGSKVSLKYKKGKGSIEVRFFNDDDLERILQLVGIPPS